MEQLAAWFYRLDPQAVAYARQREQFGQPISNFQVIQYYLAEMTTSLKAAKSLIYTAAWMETQHMPCSKEASMAKVFASEVASFVANRGMQIMSGYGYMMEHDMQRYYRECKLLEVAPGSTEIMRNIIAKQLGL